MNSANSMRCVVFTRTSERNHMGVRIYGAEQHFNDWCKNAGKNVAVVKVDSLINVRADNSLMIVVYFCENGEGST